jgi:hypothetical protein
MTTFVWDRLPVLPSTLMRSLRYFSKDAMSRTLSSTGAAQSMTNLTLDFLPDVLPLAFGGNGERWGEYVTEGWFVWLAPFR